MQRARARLILLAVLALGLGARLSVWPRVFSDGSVVIDGPDGYYHLHRAAMTVRQWPRVPQFDPAINVPAGGRISWPPLFDGLLATLAVPWPSDAALERIGAFLPPLLGIAQLAVLYALVLRLRSRRAALIATAIAAVLPAAVRYTLLGALDHDPFFTLCLLVSLLGLAREKAPLVAVGLAAGILGWTGAIVQVAIATLIVLAGRSEGASRALAIGATCAAAVVVPFVVMSPWRGATFEGLSWLHIAALAGAGLAGAALARHRTLLILNGAALVVLLPMSIRPLLGGVRYAAADAPILSLVAEAQPLLRLLGAFDLWPMLIRLGFLPLVALIVIPCAFIRRRDHALLFVAPWAVVTLTLALLHARFSFDAAIALSALAGITFDGLKAVHPAFAAFVALLPVIPAYVPLPRLVAFNFYRRENALRDYEMDRICGWLRTQPAGAVLAPWHFGHWIVWIAKKPVVIGPMLSVGQSEFAGGLRFFFIDDEKIAREFLQTHRVRYLMVTPELDTIAVRARVAGIDPSPYRDPAVYMRSVAARLTFSGPLAGYREVLRSSAYVRTPFGVVPLIRIYEVLPHRDFADKKRAP